MIYTEILQLWIREKRMEIRNSSYKNYLYTINNRVIPTFGLLDVSDITRKMIQDFIYAQSEKEKLKRETIVNITKVISQSFNYAVDNSYIVRSPYTRIKIPLDKGIKEIKVFTIGEVKRILSVEGYSQQLKNIINIAYRTGVRIGEILVLKWEDINLTQKYFTIRRTLSSYDNGIPEICEAKTKASKRRIDLDKASVNSISKIQPNGEYVFCKKDGKILSRQYVCSTFKKMCNTAKVQYHSFHSLRHPYVKPTLKYIYRNQRKMSHCSKLAKNSIAAAIWRLFLCNNFIRRNLSISR